MTMSDEITKNAPFLWNDKRTKAAFGLAEGKTRQAVADECAVVRRTIQTWLEHPEFAAEVDRLTLLTGISLRAERLRIVKRVISQSVKDDQKIRTNKDILEWLKHAQSETNGTDLLEQLVASLTTS
jgi:predicted transcriptional regulator